MEMIVAPLYGVFLYVLNFFRKEEDGDYMKDTITRDAGLKWVPITIITKRETIFFTGWSKATHGLQVGRNVVLKMTDQTWQSKAGIGVELISSTCITIPSSRLVQQPNGMYTVIETTE